MKPITWSCHGLECPYHFHENSSKLNINISNYNQENSLRFFSVAEKSVIFIAYYRVFPASASETSERKKKQVIEGDFLSISLKTTEIGNSQHQKKKKRGFSVALL